mmetsp:Transcript_21255/g.51383  ORF Transcript_21255/g.51383 Transcript_21255/m.51383 type:complete len:294 (-) Transcript_21255:94-975(-)
MQLVAAAVVLAAGGDAPVQSTFLQAQEKAQAAILSKVERLQHTFKAEVTSLQSSLERESAHLHDVTKKSDSLQQQLEEANNKLKQEAAANAKLTATLQQSYGQIQALQKAKAAEDTQLAQAKSEEAQQQAMLQQYAAGHVYYQNLLNQEKEKNAGYIATQTQLAQKTAESAQFQHEAAELSLELQQEKAKELQVQKAAQVEVETAEVVRQQYKDLAIKADKQSGKIQRLKSKVHKLADKNTELTREVGSHTRAEKIAAEENDSLRKRLAELEERIAEAKGNGNVQIAAQQDSD